MKKSTTLSFRTNGYIFNEIKAYKGIATTSNFCKKCIDFSLDELELMSIDEINKIFRNCREEISSMDDHTIAAISISIKNWQRNRINDSKNKALEISRSSFCEICVYFALKKLQQKDKKAFEKIICIDLKRITKK